MAPRENTPSVTGNHIRCVMDGKVIGLMQDLTFSDNYGNEAVSGIGNIDAVEHPPTQSSHDLRCSTVVLRRALLGANAGFPRNGAEALKGLVFDVEVYDKRDGILLRKYISCTYVSGEASITKHRVISRNASFKALTADGDL